MNLLFAFALTGLMLPGCKKTGINSDVTSAVDNEHAESVSNDVDNITDNAAHGQTIFKAGEAAFDATSPCAQVTRDTIAHTMSIDFGTGCACLDGRTRKGKIMVSYTGNYFETGAVKTITFQNYFVNDYEVQGTRTITNNGQDATTHHWSWGIVATNMKITKPDGTWVQWSSTRTREMIDGFNTPANWSDDVYQSTGSFTGSNSEGKNFTANITTPLIRRIACNWIDTGVITIAVSGETLNHVLDFGNGTCDNLATITTGSVILNITLH